MSTLVDNFQHGHLAPALEAVEKNESEVVSVTDLLMRVCF
jgi:hypothetical protein